MGKFEPCNELIEPGRVWLALTTAYSVVVSSVVACVVCKLNGLANITAGSIPGGNSPSSSSA